jgi:hypothetical protein
MKRFGNLFLLSFSILIPRVPPPFSVLFMLPLRSIVLCSRLFFFCFLWLLCFGLSYYYFFFFSSFFSCMARWMSTTAGRIFLLASSGSLTARPRRHQCPSQDRKMPTRPGARRRSADFSCARWPTERCVLPTRLPCSARRPASSRGSASASPALLLEDTTPLFRLGCPFCVPVFCGCCERYGFTVATFSFC